MWEGWGTSKRENIIAFEDHPEKKENCNLREGAVRGLLEIEELDGEGGGKGKVKPE